jgi:hypothetical protein
MHSWAVTLRIIVVPTSVLLWKSERVLRVPVLSSIILLTNSTEDFNRYLLMFLPGNSEFHKVVTFSQ